MIRSSSARAGTPAFTAAVADVVARISRVAAVQDVHRGAVAKDGHAVLVAFTVKGDKDKAVDKVQPALDAVAAAQAAHPGFTIGEFGYASAQKGVETAYSNDLGKAGALSLPITLLILVLAFGALVAAGIPLLLALTAVLATFGLIALPSHLIPVAFEAPAMVLLIGLAVGIDYSMFYLKRERQERAAGKSPEAALEAAAATSGRSVLISGLTVMGAMAGMFLTGDQIFASLGFATILVVAVAVLGSLTVLPALLSRLGDNVDRLRVPFVGPAPGRRAGPVLGSDRRSRAAPSRPVGGRGDGGAAGARPAGAGAPSRAAGRRVVPAVAHRHQDLPPDAAGVPGQGAAGQRRREGARACAHRRREARSPS